MPRANRSDFLSVQETAHALSLSERTIKRRIADGEIESVLVGGRRLIPIEFLDELATRATREAEQKRQELAAIGARFAAGFK